MRQKYKLLLEQTITSTPLNVDRETWAKRDGAIIALLHRASFKDMTIPSLHAEAMIRGRPFENSLHRQFDVRQKKSDLISEVAFIFKIDYSLSREYCIQFFGQF